MIRALAQIRATVRNRARLQLQEDAVVLEPEEGRARGAARGRARGTRGQGRGASRTATGERLQDEDIQRMENLQAQRIADEQVAFLK